MSRTIHVLLLALACLPVQATEPLLKTSTSWDGGELAYPEGQAEITAIKLIAKDGQWAPFHCHPMPTLGYVLSGTVKVQLMNGQEATFKQGESVVEVMRPLHRGQGVSGDAELVVFYAGAEGLPTTFAHGAAGAETHCVE